MRKILKSRFGSMSEVARRASVSNSMVSHFLRSEARSTNVASHVAAMVKEILAEQRA